MPESAYSIAYAKVASGEVDRIDFGLARDLWPAYPDAHQLDDRDRAIIGGRMAKLDQDEGIRVGDYVVFTNGITRRVSYHWGDGVQTSDGGSFYLGDGGVSMSGSLYPSVPLDTLTRTDETRPGGIWIFHHDWACAHNGVHMDVPFRVYTCSLPAPR